MERCLLQHWPRFSIPCGYYAPSLLTQKTSTDVVERVRLGRRTYIQTLVEDRSIWYRFSDFSTSFLSRRQNYLSLDRYALYMFLHP